MTSTTQQELERLLPELSGDQIERVVEFARFLRWCEERRDWQTFGRQQIARAYADDEPEYTLNDVRQGAPT